MLSGLIVEFLFHPQAFEISTKSLMEHAFDLTHAPSPSFTMRQASSYSPTSKTPGNDDWFANDDYGHYVRQEGKEYVMADLKGPGAVVRLWSANPMGTLRLYFDGESKPRIQTNMRDWVQNLQTQLPNIGTRFAFWAGPGWDVYLPLPYAKSLKITIEPGEKDNPKGLYYHVGYRTYASGTSVQTFRPSDLDNVDSLHPDVDPDGTLRDSVVLTPDQKLNTVTFEGPGKIQDIHLNWNYADKDLHKTLRSIWVMATFDGEKTVSAPLGDFLAAPFGHSDKQSMEAHLRFDMPFKKQATFTFERNTGFGGSSVLIDLVGKRESYRDSDPIYYFHADFSRDRGRTRPMRDMHWLDVQGEGYLAGCSLLMQNPAREWWGEGDEKIYVDGESFPSFFGTGTEDFLNYAWGSPAPYWTPAGAQSYTSTTRNSFGYCNISRFMAMDPIPFTKSLKFDLEMWHWADCVATWDRVVYWYGKSGSHSVQQTRPSWKDLELPDVADIIRIPGAIEGESLKYTKTGGESEIQSGFGDMSGDAQIWWMDAPVGAKLNVEVPIADGEYELTLGGCFARDYGIHQLYWNGEKLGQPIDFYDPNLQWKPVKLGKVRVTGGKAVLTAECVGANEKAEPRKMFAVDYLILKPVK